MQSVQEIFYRGMQRLMADCGVKATAAAYGKIALLSAELHQSQVDLIEAGGMQDILNRSFGIGGQPHTPGKIIAGSGGDVAEGYTGKIPDAIYYFIDRSVSAHGNQCQAFRPRSDFSGQFGSMSPVGGENTRYSTSS